MAKLPTSIDVGGVTGAPVTTSAVAPTDYGLSHAAEAVASVGRALDARDDAEATKILSEARKTYEPTLGERAAGYDGREAGFANRELGTLDAHLKPVLERPDLPNGVRSALQRQAEAYKARIGEHALGVETNKRAGIIADRERQQADIQVSQADEVFTQTYWPTASARDQAFDGSDPHYADGVLADFDAAAKTATEAAPEAVRGELARRLAARRVTVAAHALEKQDKAFDAYVIQAATRTVANLANVVQSNPSAYAATAADIDQAAAGLPAALRAKFVEESRGQLATARISGLLSQNDYTTANSEIEKGAYDKVLSPTQKAQLQDAVRQSAARTLQNILEAGTVGIDADPAQVAAAAQVAGDAGLKARADFLLAVGAETPGAVAGSAKGFAEAADFTIMLEGGDATIRNDNGRGVSRFGINQAANPDLDVANITRPQAVARYRKYWRDVGADRLPPGLAMVAFDAAVLFGPDDARKWVAASQGDPGAFLALERAEMHRLAKENPAKYGDDLKGWLNRTNKVQAEAARRQAFANVQEGVTSDPIKFALGGPGRAPLLAVPPLPEQPAGPEFQAALKGRLQVGQFMSGPTFRAPLRMLTDGEAAQYKDVIARNPQAALSFATEALAAVGPRAAASLLGEIGQQGNAGVHLHLADLTVKGSADFARRAETGLALKAKGDALKPAQTTAIKDAADDNRAVFAGAPEFRLVVEQTASAAMLADAAVGQPKTARAYVDAALGATVLGGRMYGGLQEVGGHVTILPAWLAKDRADEALEHLAAEWAAAKAGPTYADGSPAPLKKLHPVMLPNGRYRMAFDNGAVARAGKNDRAFEFDLDAARARLRRVLGPQGVR